MIFGNGSRQPRPVFFLAGRRRVRLLLILGKYRADFAAQPAAAHVSAPIPA
ncbi:hypothetical protein METH_05920 [Leisingera methylohalidivorans DSM 14336]|uniref:Uncharacterized protein n=1 Tax=Leisingera methylohalidivorans DSM 14336 TaxID=999552 RepID=V9VZW0_9RHOB|nr:hypothetical protein METH_05920 [Leisingera methylohalidivorans DSM 14336]